MFDVKAKYYFDTSKFQENSSNIQEFVCRKLVELEHSWRTVSGNLIINKYIFINLNKFSDLNLVHSFNLSRNYAHFCFWNNYPMNFN